MNTMSIGDFFKKTFQSWKPFELIWLGTFIALSVVLTVLFHDLLLGFFGFLFGVICVVLTAKGNVWSYVFGYVNTVFYAYIAYRNGLYGEMGLNLFFFLPSGILGFILWKRNIRKAGQLIMRITLEAFDEIALGHLEREEQAILAADRYCFIDTNAITTYMFSLDYHGRATPLLTRIANENARRYDLFFLCEDDIPYDDTWDRSGDQKRHVFHRQIIADLEARRIPYIPLKGSLEARMEQVDRVLETYVPYSNFYGNHLCFHPTPGADWKKRS